MRARRIATALAVAPLVIGAAAGAAVADTISNNLDSSVDAVAEIMPLNVGGPDGTTSLYVNPTNGDGKGGCNLTGGKTLVVSVVSSNEAVVTVSPSSVTFTSCGDIKALTVTPKAQGSADITLSQVSNTAGGTFDLAPASFRVNVVAPAPATTAPVVSVEGVTGGESYAKGQVPKTTCQVVDAEDGSSSFPAILSAVTGTYAADGIGEQTASCSDTDQGNPTASASKTYTIVDPSAPTVDYTLDPASPDGDDGWYTGDVSLTWHVADVDSPLSLAATGCAAQTVTTDQAETGYTCSATSAGGATHKTVTIKRDATAPEVAYGGLVSGDEGDNGWYTSPVTVRFTATDGLSGPATAGQNVTTESDGPAVTVDSPVFRDAAGNESAAGEAHSPAFKIDTQAPNAPTVSVDPAPNAAGWNDTEVVVHFTANGDNGPSGVAGCSHDAEVTAETGGQTVTGTCTDNAGNVGPEASVTVKLDETGPVVSYSRVVAGTKGTGEWYTSDVEVEFIASDALSGVTKDTDTAWSSGEGADVTVASPVFTDLAGNTGTTTTQVSIDKTAPTDIVFHGMTGGAAYYFGSVPEPPTCSATDDVSGVVGCEVTGDADPTSAGTHTYTATATNGAGQTSEATLTYTVKEWTLKGFYSPVDMNGVWNTVKGGSTVPLKFEVFADGELTSTSAVKGFTQKQVSCPGGAAVTDAIETTVLGGTALRYDTTGGQFIQNWQTPKRPGACYAVTVTTQDGSHLDASFQLK
jgi:hypothetical protein